MNLIYRKIKPAESLAYRNIRLESLQLYPNHFASTYEDQLQKPKLGFESFIEEELDHKFIYGCFKDGALIGICGFYILEDAYVGEIIQMYVQQQHQGEGIGIKLLKDVVAIAFNIDNLKEIQVGVLNDDLILFYEKAGFKISHTLKLDKNSEEVVLSLPKSEYFKGEIKS